MESVADLEWNTQTSSKRISLVSCNHFAGLIRYSKSIEIPHNKTGQITCYKSGQFKCSLHFSARDLPKDSAVVSMQYFI